MDRLRSGEADADMDNMDNMDGDCDDDYGDGRGDGRTTYRRDLSEPPPETVFAEENHFPP